MTERLCALVAVVVTQIYPCTDLYRTVHERKIHLTARSFEE